MTPSTRSNSAAANEPCPVCESGQSSLHARIDGYDYFRCRQCGSLHIDNATLDAIDAGHSTRIYDESYWIEELKAARERAAGESLIRAGEAILYARRPVRRFLDVGAGPGYLLDALAECFPSHRTIFHGIELFPPDNHSKHPNYLVGKIGDISGCFDAGVCIEVVEHLTPRMMANLAGELAKISAPQTLWLFNTGMPELVLGPDPGYLDPLRRGHIVSYGLQGLRHIFEPHGFRISQVPGKNHVWLAEFGTGAGEPDLEDRVLHPLSENKALLGEDALVYQAAIESTRAALNLNLMQERSRWAIATEDELNRARALYSSLQAEHEAIAKWAHRLQDELVELRNRHGALQAEHEAIATWAHKLQGELSESRTRNTMLEIEHAAVLGSRSWRVTSPLRMLVTWVRSRFGSRSLLKKADSSSDAHG